MTSKKLSEMTYEEALEFLHNDVVESFTKTANRVSDEVVVNYNILLALKEVGAIEEVTYMQARCGGSIIVQGSDLPKIRTRFPQVKDTGAYEAHSAADNTVRVQIDLGIKSHSLRIYYIKTLPPDAPCQYIKLEHQAYTTSELVCERPKS